MIYILTDTNALCELQLNLQLQNNENIHHSSRDPFTVVNITLQYDTFGMLDADNVHSVNDNGKLYQMLHAVHTSHIIQ